MPSRRTFTLLIASFLLYVFANQTQVGWMYVMSALFVGMVVAGGVMNRLVLKRLHGERQIGTGEQDEFFEGDTVSIRLSLHNTHRGNSAQINLTESCPLVDPASPQSEIRLFIPSIDGNETVSFTYEAELYRRGLVEFSPVPAYTRAPFGFFTSKRSYEVPTRLLVYPEVRKVKRLSLFDRQPTPEHTLSRVGVGSEVIGIREYRPGDSPRHIHWRSVARKGQLISKEFAEDTQPGLTLAIDLFSHLYPDQISKHVPFEWAVKSAVSVSEFAYRCGYPLHLLADEDVQIIPTGPISWHGILEYFARVQPTGAQPLHEILSGGPLQSFVAVIVPWPDLTLIDALAQLQSKGYILLAVVIDPCSFPANGESVDAFATACESLGIDCRVIQYGDDWTEALSERAYASLEMQR